MIFLAQKKNKVLCYQMQFLERQNRPTLKYIFGWFCTREAHDTFPDLLTALRGSACKERERTEKRKGQKKSGRGLEVMAEWEGAQRGGEEGYHHHHHFWQAPLRLFRVTIRSHLERPGVKPLC